MRYEGNAPQYSAFAIVAIESVWPNPEGNELSPDDFDLSLLEAMSENAKSSTRDGFKPGNVATERDYYEKQGYYKILPLNITHLETSSSISGSSFVVTFTLDDLVLVVPNGSEDHFRFATGLPISTNDLIESDEPNQLPQLLSPSGEDEANWKFVKDKDLGLSRYRVTGPYSAFNVEDLVDVNDTVTIWIYHDPQDFYVKDGLPSFDENDFLSNENDSITGIVGSADRQNQFSTEKSNFDESMLFSIGLVNKIVAEAVELDEDSPVEQITPVNKDNIADTLYLMSREASGGVLKGSRLEKIEEYVDTAFPIKSPGEDEDFADGFDETQRKYLVNILAAMSGAERFEVPEGKRPSDSDIEERRRTQLNNIISRLAEDYPDEETDGFVVVSSFDREDANIDIANDIREFGFEDPIQFIFALRIFQDEINKKAQKYADNYLKRRSSSTISQSFTNGRKVLLNESHGETPYLALKGVVSSITTSIGTTEGSYTVTLSGSGYEKVLTSNEVFYEDLLFPEVRYSPLSDFNTVYMNMSPPRAVHQIISRWAAKQIVFGKITSFSDTALNRNFWLRKSFGTPEEDEEPGEEETNHYKEGFSGKEGAFLIRGMLVYSDYADSEGFRPENLRVFAPVNYLDITRIREMNIVLDRSYENPTEESRISAAQSLAGRSSIMENIRRVGGVANFYEMFVDETGRFRYRLTFEAMERTPNPGYTPIIQDYELLSSGNAFSVDDSRLSTVVDVTPILTSQVTVYQGLAFIGRSAPRVGKFPIDNDGEVPIPEETISPELFRYGLRTLKIQDLYQSERGGARRKAHLYRMFYGEPIKQASLRVRNSTSFRPGETVLVNLQRYKKRSRTLIDLNKMIEWMEFLEGDKEAREMYIGVDTRLLTEGKSSYIYTGSDDYLPIPNEGLYGDFSKTPHNFVATAFKNTFIFILDALGDVGVITPEYFPTTYWYHTWPDGKGDTGGFRNWDQGTVESSEIVKLYKNLIIASVRGDKNAKDKISILLSKPENQGIINAIKFQNFKCTSYYIDGVAHKFSYGEEATTHLKLDFGQDNLVLLEPNSLLPIGFISLEKKMKIGYNDEVQEELYQEHPSTYSAMQKMYLNQFKEDRQYKEASFLFRSQYLRNSSNYMYEIAHIYDPFDVQHVEFPDVEKRRTDTSTDTYSGWQPGVSRGGKLLSSGDSFSHRTEVELTGEEAQPALSSLQDTRSFLYQERLRLQREASYEEDLRAYLETFEDESIREEVLVLVRAAEIHEKETHNRLPTINAIMEFVNEGLSSK